MQETLKRQSLPSFSPGFYFVSTPIGNLGDLTPRALEVLRQATHVLCEDTRVTLDLYRAFDLKAPKLIRYDQHTNDQQCRLWTQEYAENPSLWAVVSDAGTPGVSDPGASIAAAVGGGWVTCFYNPRRIFYDSIALNCGFSLDRVCVHGIFPAREKRHSKKM